MADETIVIESDKSSKFRILKRPYDSAQSSMITQNNEIKTMEKMQIDTSSKIENLFDISIYKQLKDNLKYLSKFIFNFYESSLKIFKLKIK